MDSPWRLTAMRRWTVISLALSCIADVAFANKSVYFQSRDFHHKLHWAGVSGDDPTAEPVLYNVQHKIYGEPEWKGKDECQHITALSCDLTAEMSDITNYYYARVSSGGVILGQSSRFQPLKGTVLSPPDVTIIPGVQSLNLRVRLPKRPDNNSYMAHLVFSHVAYKANLTYHNQTHKIIVIEMSTNSSDILFERLQNNMEYHVSVCYVLTLNKQSEAFHGVIKTLAVSDRRDLFLIPGLLAVVILLFSFLMFCQMYVRKKPLIPDSLKLLEGSHSLAVMHFPAVNITTPDVDTYVTDVCVDKKYPPPVPKTGGDSYTPQVSDSDEQSWHCNSYTAQQGEANVRSMSTRSNSTQSSTNYSLVVVQRSDEGAERRDGAPQGCTPKSDVSTPLGTSLCPGQLFNGESRLATPNRPEPFPEEEAGTLVLPAFRRSDGKLEVSSLFTFLQVEQEEEEEEAPGMAATGEASMGAEAAVNVGGTSYLPNQTPAPSCAGQPIWTPSPVPDWNGPSGGHASSGYRANGQEARALLPPSPQDTRPNMGAGAGGAQGYLSQDFSNTWGLLVQE
ncbi:hypothetical protein SKAU_G00113100 [Synaphobranchus kaupii]|uniref:Fibronectin type-III domain-containing protein n=1 Tax=Synaphobranchus kaupii TaxID=118154 RepID=A0A9Q1J7I7_SYNKA|nr:hypothetical protein SKAU_G00113100 [Synaphobranchus kaupii]